MKNYDGVIFDLDGTLLNTLEDLMDSVNYGLKAHHMPEEESGGDQVFRGKRSGAADRAGSA